MKTCVVVPTIRPERILDFMEAWDTEFKSNEVEVIVVEDNPERSFDAGEIQHYSWKEIDADLGEDSFIIPRRNSGIRTYGFLKAWEQGADFVVTLDDDTRPEKPGSYIIQTHLKNLTHTNWDDSTWWSVGEESTRGLPYHTTRRTSVPVISHGVWSGVPDIDSIKQLGNPVRDMEFYLGVVPLGQYFPMSYMNLAFRREILPAIVPIPMGKGQPFDRFDDIWAGIIAKKVCDHFGLMVWSGTPSVYHERASNPFDNLIKEAPGIKENEVFWTLVDRIVLTSTTIKGCVREIAEGLMCRSDYYDSPLHRHLPLAQALDMTCRE